MVFKNTNIKELLDSNKRLVCFGAGKMLKSSCELFSELSFFERIYRVLDNNAESFEWQENRIPVFTLEQFLASESGLDDVNILITCLDYPDVFAQLDGIPALKDTPCYVMSIVKHRPPPYAFPAPAQGAVQKIPKKIHYFWFGGKQISEKNLKIMESWQRYCPDYEIIRWDESNYDVTKHPYMHSAYKEKLWGFVPDYARLEVVYRYGGVYLDTDVEVLRNLDPLLYDEAFCGRTFNGVIATGLGFGAVKGFPLLKKLFEHYDGVSFYRPDGTLNLDDCGVHQTAVLDRMGLKRCNDSWQMLEGMRVYPTDVLNPTDVLGNPCAYTENTFTVHHYDASWIDDDRASIRRETLKKCKWFWEKYAAGVIK